MDWRTEETARDPEAVIRLVVRRHWYEVVPEAATMIFWEIVIVLVTIGLGQAFGKYVGPLWGRRMISLILLTIFPAAPFALELWRWWNEIYLIKDFPNGRSVLIKRQAKLIGKRGQAQRDRIEGVLGDMSPEETSTWFSRFVGFRWVKLYSKTNIMIDGNRVPDWFVLAINQKPPKIVAPDAGNAFELALTSISSWVQQGLLSREKARVLLQRMMEEIVG